MDKHRNRHELNIDSSKQMKEYFYDCLQLPLQRDKKSKSPSMGKDAMEVLSHKEPLVKPLLSRIKLKRSARVFPSTFVEAALEPNGRLMPHFNIGGTETYRFSSSTNPFWRGMNVQNQPSGTNSPLVSYVKEKVSVNLLDCREKLLELKLVKDIKNLLIFLEEAGK